MPSPSPSSPHDDAFEELLVEALERFEVEGPTGAERFLAAHPQHADRLRAHFERLHRVGLTSSDDDTAAATPTTHPERLGEFRIVQLLGGGAMGVVYRAVQESLGREVALKVVRPDQLLFPGIRERFRREFELVARMQHPGIVPIHTVGQDANVPFFAMELVRGASLADVVAHVAAAGGAPRDGAAFDRAIATHLGDTGPREVAALFAGSWVQAVLRIVREIAEALEHAHRRGVLHRDVKPSNVMLTRDGRVLLLDFGLAGADGGERLTRTGSPLGSLAYMPPEVLAGAATRDARGDVYSLGVTCWELLSLRLPYQSSDPVQLLALANGAARPKLSAVGVAVGWEIETVLATAMDPDPARRYASASALSRDLDNLLHNRPIDAREVGTWLRVRRWTQRHPARATAAAAAFLLFFVAPSAFLWQRAEASERLRRQDAAANERVRRQEAAANERIRGERDRAREAVESLLTRVATEDLLHAPRLQRVRRDLLASARSFYDRFLQDSRGDAELLADASYAALQLANLDGELGQVAEARASAEQAVALARELVARDGAIADGAAHAGSPRERLGDALLSFGKVQQLLGDLEAAATSFTEVHALLGAARAADPQALDVVTDLLAAERARALVLDLLGRADESAACYRTIAALWREVDARAPNTATWRMAHEHSLAAAADETAAHLGHGRVAAARAAQVAAAALVATMPDDAPLSSHIASARLQLSRARLAALDGDAEAAEEEMREALATAAQVREQNPDHANALRLESDVFNSLSLLLSRSPTRRDEARPLLQASIERLRRLIALDPIPSDRSNVAVSLGNLGAMLQHEGELLAALAVFDEATASLDAAERDTTARPNWTEQRFKLTWFRGQVQGALGRPAPTLAAAKAMAALKPADARTHRIAAGLCATAAAATATANDGGDAAAALRDEAQRTGMTLLQRAAELGCTDLEWLRNGAEFAPLRGLDGYAAILTKVEANVANQQAAGAAGKAR